MSRQAVAPGAGQTVNTPLAGSVRRSRLAEIAVNATEGLGHAITEFIERQVGEALGQGVLSAEDQATVDAWLEAGLGPLADQLGDEATVRVAAALEAQATGRGYRVLDE
jgi:hypothetical protein